ncbi:MAG: putative peptidoglycan glycosyltransferase FtsW [Planctomycetota bacterium]|nr:putative peptidoglycan glycosyltransferase FtsW [Planctomycetota bacterium]
MTSAALPLRRGPGYSAQHAGRVVLAVAAALASLGVVMVYSTTAVKGAAVDSALSILQGDSSSAPNPIAAVIRQLRWVLLAVLTCWIVARTPLEWFQKISRPVLFITLILLASTLVLGPLRNQSRRWLDFGPIAFQPSELLKIAALLYLADQLSRRERATAFGHRTPLLAILAPVGVGAVLVLVEPDLGTSLFIVAEAIVLLGLAGVRPTRFLPFVITAMPLLVIYGYTRFAHVRKRFELYASGPQSGTQIEEALIGLGSGGVIGVGLGEGTHKLGYVAEARTDFIFTVIGEELGFLGCAGVVVAFMLFTFYGRRVAWQARALGPHAFYLAAGATFIVAFQALINIAVVTATAPTKGVSLPFISVGGSNLLMAATCVGLILNVSRRTAEHVSTDPWG